MADHRGIAINAAQNEVLDVKVNAGMTQVIGVYVNAAMDLVWPKADPLTLSLYPNWSYTYMYNGSQTGDILGGIDPTDVGQGYWDVGQATPPGNWDHVTGLISFYSLDTYTAVRPVIKSASLRLTSKVVYGGLPASTHVLVGVFDPVTGTTPLTTSVHTDVNRALQDTGVLFTAVDQTKTIILNAAVIAQLQSGKHGIALHDNTHGTSETRKRETRAYFEGAPAAAAVRPQLTVTLDYV